MPIATIELDFDPLLRLSDAIVLRWGTVALAVVIAIALLAAAAMARRASLRLDDLLFIAVGVVPGAVIGGRLGYALLHLAVIRSQPTSIFDPAVGGFELGLALAGGLFAGAYVAHLLGARVEHWLHIAVVPMLFALGAGKLTMLLTGAGQGSPSTDPWATVYLGAGPWSTLAPTLPSHPAQLYEGLAVLTLAAAFAAALVLGAFGSRDGRVMVLAIGAWALVRAGVSLTWRDPVVLGPFNAGGLIALGMAISTAVILGGLAVQRRRFEDDARDRIGAEAPIPPPWSDPTGSSRS